MPYRAPLGSLQLLGIRVELDRSVAPALPAYAALLALVLFALAPALPRPVFLATATLGAVGLFASLLAHELGHACTAHRLGLRVARIRIWSMGAVSERLDAARTPGAQLRILVAGPAVSLVAAAGLGLALWPAAVAVPAAVPLLLLLAASNLLIAITNLLPVIPLDGGQILLALLWRRTGDAEIAHDQAERASYWFARTAIGAALAFAAAGPSLPAALMLLGLGIHLHRLPRLARAA